MKKISLEDNFDFKQKAIILVLISFPLLMIFSFFNNFQNFKHSDKLILNCILVIICMVISIMLSMIMFSKKGLMFKNGNLYLTYVFIRKTIYSKYINIENKTSFTVFKKKVTQKNSYLSTGGADLSYRYLIFDIMILNQNHLDKEKIMTVNKIESVNKIKLFLEDLTPLKWVD